MTSRTLAVAFAVAASAALGAAAATLQVTAKVPAGPDAPAWGKGIQAISRDSYWNAVACGKQKGNRPVCVFPDADLCKNPDYTLAFFTPYKQVAYEVWTEVHAGREAPTPNYNDSQKTRVTIGLTPVTGARNPITALTIKRGGRTIQPATQSIDGSGGGRFIFDYAPFAPTEPIVLEMTGKTRTVSCTIGVPVLKALR